MIKKIPLPETIEDGWQHRLDWMIAEALNSIIDHLNRQMCTCPATMIARDCPIHGYGGFND